MPNVGGQGQSDIDPAARRQQGNVAALLGVDAAEVQIDVARVGIRLALRQIGIGAREKRLMAAKAALKSPLPSAAACLPDVRRSEKYSCSMNSRCKVGARARKSCLALAGSATVDPTVVAMKLIRSASNSPEPKMYLLMKAPYCAPLADTPASTLTPAPVAGRAGFTRLPRVVIPAEVPRFTVPAACNCSSPGPSTVIPLPFGSSSPVVDRSNGYMMPPPATTDVTFDGSRFWATRSKLTMSPPATIRTGFADQTPEGFPPGWAGGNMTSPVRATMRTGDVSVSEECTGIAACWSGKLASNPVTMSS